ncbi:Cyclin-D3-1 [Nymphaea thermarum]|nr:Cyclin-D3-1 [Nymphaea thermarum]
MRLRSIVCLSLLICFLLVTETDSRFICYMPSIVASSIMLYVINQLEPFNAMEYENQLLGVMEISKVPLLLDLQVEEAQYVFEAKTIQRMELLILSSLEWKMHPVTPLSFIDHTIRRFGMKTHQHWEFFRRCERLILSLITGVYMDGYLCKRRAEKEKLH